MSKGREDSEGVDVICPPKIFRYDIHHMYVFFLGVTWPIRCLISPSKTFPFFDSLHLSCFHSFTALTACNCTCTVTVRGVQAADSSMTAIDNSAVAVAVAVAVGTVALAHATLPSTRYVAVDLFGELYQQHDVMQ